MLGATLSPSLASFTPTYDKGLSQLVHTVLVGDLETPVSAFMKLRGAFSGHAFLLESVEGDRPMSIVWKLATPLPAKLLREYSVLRGM